VGATFAGTARVGAQVASVVGLLFFQLGSCVGFVLIEIKLEITIRALSIAGTSDHIFSVR
jgi:hypothetical protein